MLLRLVLPSYVPYPEKTNAAVQNIATSRETLHTRERDEEKNRLGGVTSALHNISMLPEGGPFFAPCWSFQPITMVMMCTRQVALAYPVNSPSAIRFAMIVGN